MPTFQEGDIRVSVETSSIISGIEEINKSIQEELARSEKLNFQPAITYAKKLAQISGEYLKTLKAADKTLAAQTAYAKPEDINLRFEKLKPTHAAFQALQQQLGSQKTMKLINIPPLTDDLKNNMEPKHFTTLTKMHNDLKKTKEQCMQVYQTLESIQKKIADFWDKQIAKKQSTQVHPVPLQPSSPQAPLSSSHGAQYSDSQQRAAAANQRPGADNQQNQAGQKK